MDHQFKAMVAALDALDKAMEPKGVQYVIYVADDNGWFDGCPDYQSVFFGLDSKLDENGWRYDSELPYRGGALIFDSARQARLALHSLSQSGDWVTESGEERRPKYAMEHL